MSTQKPVLYHMRSANAFLRAVAATVVITFGMLILAPTAMAARSEVQRLKQQASLEPSDEGKMSLVMQKVEKKLSELQGSTGEKFEGKKRELKELRDELLELDETVSSNFAEIGKRIKDKKLSSVILKRHEDAVQRYRQGLSDTLQGIDAVEQEQQSDKRKQKVQQLRARHKKMKHKRSQQPFDPENLPTRLLRPQKDRKPKLKREEYRQSGLFDTPYVKVAALGDFTFDNLPGANDPAYLAPSDEVVLSQAIQDKAAELEHDPIKIHNWVRNNIQWQPTWGAVQNAELTLSAKRGNAMDIASLTIALLRASGIPSRYVHGAIEVPVEKFKNWAGRFSSIEAATNFASSGGIPITSIISGGKITMVRLEHIWVEAATDYFPSRGAKNLDADSWISMDPSYKQYEYQEGLDVAAISGIDPEQLTQSFLDSGTVNEDESWVMGLDSTVFRNAEEQAQNALEQYINDNMTDPTMVDVIGGRVTIIKEYQILPSGLPNRVIARGASYGSLPAQLQQKITFALGKDILGDPINPVTFPWSTLNNERVTLSFNPATEDDEQALQALLPDGAIADFSQVNGSIPAYLINVIPQIKVNGEVVMSGTAMNLGEELDLVTAIDFAQRADYPARTYKVISGSFLALNVIAGNVSSSKLRALQARLEQVKTILETQDQQQIQNIDKEDMFGNMFYTGTLSYYSQYIAYIHIEELKQQGNHYLAAGYGTIGHEPTVSYFFGIPRSIEPGGLVFDIPMIHVSEVGDGDAEKRKQFVMQTGMLSSALEHSIPEQMFDDLSDTETPDAISAVKAMQKANANGQRIYQITQSNMGTTLGNIHHDSDTMIEIRSALLAGKDVIAHTNAVSVPGWSGAGYIILDPDTGVGSYKIAGGSNGGHLDLDVNASGYADAVNILDCVIKNVIATISDFLLYRGVLKNAKNPNSVFKRFVRLIGSRSVALIGLKIIVAILLVIIAINFIMCITSNSANEHSRKRYKYV